MLLPWILCSIVAIALVAAVIKIILLKKSMNEICSDFQYSIAEDTTLVDDYLDYRVLTEPSANANGTVEVIDDNIRNANYIYRYGDRKATFERKAKLKELFEVIKSFAQVPEVEEKIDWMECFKFALEQYGIENSNNFLVEK